MNKVNKYTLATLAILLWLPGYSALAAVTDFQALPPTIQDSTDPNVMINLSIESPMRGAAYNDQDNTASGGNCTGRPESNVGTCYFTDKEYLGYFDPEKCYTYDTTDGRFEPAATAAADHSCTGQWSGNFLNWATMTAIDEFRWALTGGNRVTDTYGSSATTVLERANRDVSAPSNWYPSKRINSSDNVAPSTVTPYSDSTIWINSHGTQIDVGTTEGGDDKANDYNVRVQVCDPTISLEDNCVKYTDGTNDWYKPEGLIQENALRVRFAVMSYLKDDSQSRDGGVLRANMKYTGPYRPADTGGFEANPNKEWDTNGVQLSYTDPDDLATADADISYSGVINYINKFGANGYKSYDPVGELYYECLNYFKKRGPTPEYSDNLTAAMKDDFPVINGSSYSSSTISGNNNWVDPIIDKCQKNYIIGINDANPWLDKTLPGTHWGTSGKLNSVTGDTLGDDYGEPSNADPDINVTSLTNTIGDLEGITGTSQCIGGVDTNWDGNANNKTITALGEAIGTCPSPAKQNSYYVAGLAYYARTTDLRTEAGMDGDQTIETFMIDTQEYNNTPLTGQMNMLWLAGKYGGFTELDDLDTNSDGNNMEPNLTAEWDEDGDGTPDNYVLATDPAKLVNGLERAFANIEHRVRAGSAAAVIADTVSMTGGVVQALYQPEQIIDGKTLTWTGLVHSVFIDDEGNLREDTNGNGKLDDYTTDKWVRILYDEAAGRTRVFYCNHSDSCATYDSVKEIEDLNPIWNARDQLAEISNSRVIQQRSYTTSFGNSSNGGRHIFTWLDDGDGDVDSGEVVDFEDDNIDGNNFGYLNAADETEAKNIVNFIRGQEGISGYRNRTADYDGNGEKAWRLGDIVHSTPLIVSKPDSNWDTRFGDDTYRNFRAQYENRRGVVYVGANDGMLHAFNAGFFDPNNSRFCLKDDCSATTVADDHPLGAELWAYVPKNLLPHLRWLTEPDYPHVYYMDGKPQAFDVNIFPDNDDHPDGWGTILVVGMRLGGGEIDVDYDDDGTADYTAQSAYVILDVTNPEEPPELLAEFTDADLGFTTSAPQIAVRRQPDDNVDWTEAGSGTLPNDWYLVFGNGPTDLDTVTSTNNAQVYALELELVSGRLDVDSSQVTKIDTGITDSFVGDPAVADWSNDFLSDAIYFGTVGGTASNPDGRLMRVAITTDTVSDWALSANRGTLIDPGQPFVHRPELRSIDKSPQNEWWIYASTGRLYTAADNSSIETQSMYGIREIHDSTYPNMLPDVNVTASRDSTSSNHVQDVTGVRVFTDASVDVPTGLGIDDPDDTDPFTFNEFESVINNRQGWYFDFESDGTNPASRGISRATFWQNLVLFNSYTPPDDTLCESEGHSDLWAVYYTTGTAHWDDIGLNITDTSSTNGVGGFEKMPKVELGYGIASDITLYRTKDGSKPIIQLTTGEIVETDEVLGGKSGSGRQSWREIPLE